MGGSWASVSEARPVSSLVDSLRKVGAVHCRGEFTLDLERADAKMARFQFREEHEFLYQLVAGLYRPGARAVVVGYEAGVLSIAPQGLALPDSLPKDLADHLLEEFSPWRRLAAACQAALAHNPDEFGWLGQSAEQSYDYRTGQSRRWTHVQLREIRLVGLPVPLVEKALQELSLRASYSRRPLSIQGRAVPCQATPKESVAGQFGMFFCDPQLTPHLELVVDEMTSEGKAIPAEIPWWGVVYWDVPQVRLDASLAAVVEDQAFHSLLEAIPQTFARLVLELLPRSEQPPTRAFLLELLRPPAPLWLHPIYAQIARLELFRDQQGKRWSLASLQHHCQEQSEPLYYSTAPTPTELPDIIIQESCPSALVCLRVHLGEQLVEATPLLLRQLQRQANQRNWQERPQTGLQLPVQDWLVQRTYAGCVMGIPEDWCQPGGSVCLLYQDKLLVRRNMPQAEVSFAVVCEISEEQISELWDDVQETVWLEWVPIWLTRLQELIEELAQSPPQLSPMRAHLLEHLARSSCPEESYFAKTLLFRDWNGQLHSLFSLLTARGEGYQIGTLAPHHRVEDYPAAFLPKAIYVQAESLENGCLAQAKALSLRDFDVLLADLQEARNTAPPPELDSPWAVSWQADSYFGSLEIAPRWGPGEVRLFIQGIRIENELIPSEVSFVAHVHSDEFKLQIRSGNSRLGSSRYSLAKNAPWKHCQEALVKRVYASLLLRLQSLSRQAEEPWSDWAIQAALRGYARVHPDLAEVVHFPAYPQELSLASLLASPIIHWCSERPAEGPLREFMEKHPTVALLAPLANARQKQLVKAYGGQWACQDAWFTQNARLQEFLKQPAAEFGHPQALASALAQEPLQGMLLLINDLCAEGSAAWHYRQRPVISEPISRAQALLAQVECNQLEPNEDLSNLEPAPLKAKMNELVRQQLVGLLLDWLRTPHPEQGLFSRVWPEWQQLDPEIEPLLRRQPWFSTNHGWRSWEQLMQVPILYCLPTDPGPDFADLTLALDATNWPLLEAHPKLVSVIETMQLVEDRWRWKQQQANLRCQAQRLQGHRYKVDLQPPNQGEVALLGKGGKDFWLVLADRAVLVNNLPNGLAGYLQTEDFRLTQLGQGEQAELGRCAQQQILADLLPLWLRRIEAGSLSPVERETLAEYALQAPGNNLLEARWLPCADGTLTSLRQLQLESAERGQLLYWERSYPLSSAATLTPLLPSPLLTELVRRCCGVAPTPRPKPLLFRNLSELAVPRLSSVRELLEGLGRWIRSRPGSGLVQAVRKVMVETEAVPQATESGQALLTALRRQASLMLQGVAREETMGCLEQMSWSPDSRPSKLWHLDENGSLTLFAQHPTLRRWLGDNEPPAPVTLSLLLGLVSVINARSAAFTDDMERDFLEHLIEDLVASYKDLLTPTAS